MTGFPLKIVTPDGVQFDGTAQQVTVRTTTGDVSILARHPNFVAPLGMGQASVLVEGQMRYAACIGGMISVVDGNVTLVPTTFEWADTIDVARAEISKKRAEDILADQKSTDIQLKLAEARLKSALVRKGVAGRK